MTSNTQLNTYDVQRDIIDYYRVHSRFYDITRWTFLFGKTKLLRKTHQALPYAKRITEFGCGSGKNLLLLSRLFPQSYLTGIDISPDMLHVARKCLSSTSSRIQLVNASNFDNLESKQDIILFSYSLSMVFPDWRHLIAQAVRSLEPGGLLAVVDFHTTPIPFYRQFMKQYHVQLTGEYLPYLKSFFPDSYIQVNSAYLRAWSYYTFIGFSSHSSSF